MIEQNGFFEDKTLLLRRGKFSGWEKWYLEDNNIYLVQEREIILLLIVVSKWEKNQLGIAFQIKQLHFTFCERKVKYSSHLNCMNRKGIIEERQHIMDGNVL